MENLLSQSTLLMGMHKYNFAYPGVRDNRSTINTKTGYDEEHKNLDMDVNQLHHLEGLRQQISE